MTGWLAILRPDVFGRNPTGGVCLPAAGAVGLQSAQSRFLITQLAENHAS